MIVALDENCLGTETRGGYQRHGGVYPEGAGFVGGGGDYAPAVRFPAHDHRLALQLPG